MSVPSPVESEARLAVATAVNRPLLAYWKARLDKHKNDLMLCNETQFKEIRGRALEAAEFVKFLESVKE